MTETTNKAHRHLSESIYSGDRVIIPLADVQHIEKLTGGGLWIITRHTHWEFDRDNWDNPIFLNTDEAEGFLKVWCQFRSELDGVCQGPECNHPDTAADELAKIAGELLSYVDGVALEGVPLDNFKDFELIDVTVGDLRKLRDKLTRYWGGANV